MKERFSYLRVAAVAFVAGAVSTRAAAGAEDAEATVFEKLVAPIFSARCVECHGEETTKGKLRLDSPEGITAGGSEGDTVVAGASADSVLIFRITLPNEDDERMPSEGEPLTADQIEAIRWWIDEQKASFEVKLAAVQVPDSLQKLLSGEGVAAAAGTKAEPEEEALKEVAPADPAAIEAVTALGILATPLAQNTNLLHVTAVSVRDQVGDEQARLLEPLAEQITWLYLNNTKISDQALDSIAKLKNLTRLHLANTAITDAGVAKLEGLGDLEILNVYGSQVTDAVLPLLANMSRLEKVYLYETKVSPREAFRFLQKKPDLDLNLGWEFEDFKQLNTSFAHREAFDDAVDGTPNEGSVGFAENAPQQKAGVFDGKVFLEVGDKAGYDKGEAFSVASWVKAGEQEEQVIAARMDTDDANRGWDLHLRGGKPVFQLISNGEADGIRVASTVAIPAGSWHYLAASYDGSGKAEGVKL
ncbi:MAG TPA: c-type cytochrome domain-containing protein, partial [Verrucomicrobiales bacterium]|nr:c-type cytochrome domain-containing protein [Verrucomicrobiales bacterium]